MWTHVYPGEELLKHRLMQVCSEQCESAMATGTGQDTVDAGGPQDAKGALVANKVY
jgi:hypothetical protein